METVQVQQEKDLCPHSVAVKEFSELRRCAVWGLCGKAGFAGNYRRCPTYVCIVKLAEKEK